MNDRIIKDLMTKIGDDVGALIGIASGTLLEKIRGKDLACWCSLDQPCHADVLLKLANR